MFSIMHVTKTLRFISLIIVVVGLKFGAYAADYNKYVGESFNVPIPKCPVSNGYINSYSFSCKDIRISVDNKYGLAVINKYFAGTVYIECFYQYIYYINKTPYSNTSTAYYSVSCRSNNISISAPYYSLSVGDGIQLECNFSHQVYDTPQITYKVSDTSVISVSSSGYVRALRAGGPVTVTASSNLGENTSSVTFNVKAVTPTGVSLPKTLSLFIGESETLIPELYPENATSSFKWDSDDKSIASVSSMGKVTGINEGKTKIRVTTDIGCYSDFCDVTVKKRKLTLSSYPTGGVYPLGTVITLESNNKNSTIYFTTDGSIPTEKSHVYNNSITLDRNFTLKAVAKADKYIDSDILTEIYEVQTLFVVDTYPKSSTNEVDKLIRPSITFSTPITEGANFSRITFSEQGGHSVDGYVYLSDNELVFVPDNTLQPLTNYVLSIPNDAVVTSEGQGNKSVTLKFKIADYQQAKIVRAGNNCCVKDDGTAWLWNYNKYSGFDCWLPDKITDPQRVMTDVTHFGASSSDGYYIKTDKSLWKWGFNKDGYLDNGAKQPKPDPVLFADNVIDYQTGFHNGILKQDGSLWLWGRNRFGAIGNGDYTYTPTSEKAPIYTPYKVMTDVVAFELSAWGTLALKSNHDLYAWGDDVAGKRFSASYSDKDVVTYPQKIMSDVNAIACGSFHAFAIKTDGSLWGWGLNSDGVVGNGLTSFVSSPVKIMDNVKKVDASIVHSMVLKEDGTVWCWGGRANGGIGLGKNSSSSTPKKITDDVIDIWLFDEAAYFVKSDGSLWGWGRIYPHPHSFEEVYIPTKIIDDFDMTIPSGFSSFVKTDGSLWEWTNTPSYSLTERFAPFTPSDLKALTYYHPELRLTQGDVYPLQPMLNPSNSDIDIISYCSEDENIARVSPKGIVTAIKPGTTKIFAEACDAKGNYAKADITITILENSSINQITPDSATNISTEGNIVIVSNKEPMEIVNIYTIDGRMIFSGKDDRIIIPNSGVYLIKVGISCFKVVINS